MSRDLPKLQYAYDALEPFIDAKTVEIHYTKHHKTYLDKFVAAIENHKQFEDKKVEELLKHLHTLPSDIQAAVQNFGGGFYNHNLFWEGMTASKTSIDVESDLGLAIERDFGGQANMVEKFTNKAVGLFGSGWTWLVSDKMGKLTIVNTVNQDNPISNTDCKLLLALDVWEHSYYLKYQNRRAEYIENWWNVVNWEVVEERYIKE
jgi:Fe-Mn family superoxide dismutase